MVEVQLTKAVRIPPAQALQWSGKIFDVDEFFAEELVSQGKAVYLHPVGEVDNQTDGAITDVVVSTGTEASEDPAVEVGEITEANEAPEVVEAPTTRPKKTASLAVWREYAASKGLKTTGMKLPEIIGAIESQNL